MKNAIRNVAVVNIGLMSLLSLAALAACSDASEENVSRTSAAIINGAASANDGVGIVYFSNDSICSGFLAAPNVVVTAAFCFNGGRTPTAFYTGAGAAVTSPIDVGAANNLTKYTVKSFAKHPQASPQAAETGATAYTATNDVAYVVLDKSVVGTPLEYGKPAATNACTTLGYGRDGTTLMQGKLGLRRQGQGTINGTVPGSNALLVVGSNLSNSGDFGGPLLCNGNVAAIFSSYHSNAQSTIDSNAYQPISGNIKTWIDGIVAANPPPKETMDAGGPAEDASTPNETPDSSTPTGSKQPNGSPEPDHASTPSAPAASDPSSPPAATPGGCSIHGSADEALGWLVGLAVVLGAAGRRRRDSR